MNRTDLETAGLTHELMLGLEKVPPETVVPIARKTVVMKTYWLELAEDGGASGDLSLEAIVKDGASTYAILEYPADITEGSQPVPRIAVRILDSGHVKTVSKDEIDKLIGSSSRIVESATSWSESAPQAVLGSFERIA